MLSMTSYELTNVFCYSSSTDKDSEKPTDYSSGLYLSVSFCIWSFKV